MRKFEVVIETTKTYVVEIDDSKVTEEDLKGWESVFRSLDLTDDKVESFVADYCECRAREGDTFIEGHGRVLEKDKVYPYKINEQEICEYMKMIECDDGDVYTQIKEL